MIEETLLEYKSITTEIIREVKLDADVEELFNKRQLLIDSLLQFDKKGVREAYLLMEVNIIDNELQSTIIQEQLLVKEEIQKINRTKNANKVYANNSNRISFFNKET